MENYDYSENGYYFVTICTQNKQNFFGEIIDGKMILNELGKVAEEVLKNLSNYYNNFIIDEYIFMPNHFHGIFVINNTVGTGLNPVPSKDNTKSNLENGTRLNLVPTEKQYGLSQIIGSFKLFTFRKIHQDLKNFEFSWQRSFYDTVLRSEKQYLNTKQYIIDNPLKWEFDEYNKINNNNIITGKK